MNWWRRLVGRPRWRAGLIALFVAANLPWLYLPRTWGIPDLPPDWVIALIVRPFMTWQVGLLLWLVLVAALSLLALIFFRIPARLAVWFHRGGVGTVGAPPADPGRRDFLVRSARAAAWGGALALGGWGLVRSSFGPCLVRHDLELPGLPAALDGLRIAHLTDIHIGRSITEAELDRALDLAGQLKPDLVVITGDIVDENPAFTRILTGRLDLLGRPPLGVFGIIGNHDVYTGADAVTAGLEAGRMVMLRNRHHSLEHLGLPLSLVGLDDPGRQWTGSGGLLPLNTAVKGMPEHHFPILLVHRPTAFDQARANGIPLTLCGHTHGGQFGLPGGPNLADLAYEYTHGVYRRPGGLVHVSAGLGAVGLPIRIGVDPEVALLVLKAKPARTET